MLNLPVKNIEFKARCADLQAVRERLEELGVPLDRRMRQVDTYFEVSSGRLKLREIGDGEAQLVQYHRPDESAVRACEYTVVPVKDAAGLKRALSLALGVRVVVDKVRELYLWDHTRVHLDTVEELGTFLELETVVTDQTLENARAECERIKDALMIRDEDILSGSYADLMQS
jgi:predicted adenylyl cyclase CyaB